MRSTTIDVKIKLYETCKDNNMIYRTTAQKKCCILTSRCVHAVRISLARSKLSVDSWCCPAKFWTLTHGPPHAVSWPAAGGWAGGRSQGHVGGKPSHDPHLFQKFPHPDSYHLLPSVVIVQQERVLLGNRIGEWEIQSCTRTEIIFQDSYTMRSFLTGHPEIGQLDNRTLYILLLSPN